MKVCAIIAAGGSGKRMKSKEGKQFIELLGKPMLLRTLEKFEATAAVNDIILVIAPEQIDAAESLVKKQKLAKVRKIIKGGKRRQDSVLNGLKAIDFACDVVLVHDGARPLVTAKEIKAVIDGVKEYEACIAAGPVKDTLKIVDEDSILETPDRSRYWAAKTPQGFKLKLLKEAFEQAKKQKLKVTDDAMLVEAMGHKVKIVEASCYNIKITTPEDLYVAEGILNERKT